MVREVELDLEPESSAASVKAVRPQTGPQSVLEGIARGEQAICDSRILTQEEVRQRLGRWLT